MLDKTKHPLLLIALVPVFMWSAIRPHDYFTWFLEVFPVIFGVIALGVLYPRFKFTSLVYTLIAVHMVILMIGGHYTYAEVPAFDWIRDGFGLSRNHYDRVGHFAQGFIPAMIAREVLLRKSPLRPGGWLFFLIVCIALAISAFYELIEWWVAAATGTAAEAFLGTQGDVWDTQTDMFLAMVGAIVALILLSKPHDRALAALRS